MFFSDHEQMVVDHVYWLRIISSCSAGAGAVKMQKKGLYD